MLYYSGHTRRIGDVDDGSTVTDFLPAERERGITIQSAAVTFQWPPTASPDSSPNVPRSQIQHTINLIDTPGHADFTFEVLRSLRILDGAVCIFDGVAGVEAQTEKVWAQACKYRIPRIAFINKLDRDGAAFGRTVKDIGSRLRGWPAVCQIPWWEGGKGRFKGVGDAVNLRALSWEQGGDGKTVKSLTLEELLLVDPNLCKEIKKARAQLVEVLCQYDENLLGKWLDHDEDSLAIPASEITESLRRCIISGSGNPVPVFAGASFRNIGVQPLLDAVNDLLPDPTERPDPEVSLGKIQGKLSDLLNGKLEIGASQVVSKKKKAPSSRDVQNIEGCALAFKVVNDPRPRRGVLVYVRVYSGSIKRHSALWNTSLNVTERAERLLQMYASDAEEIEEIQAGQIGVIVGLKYARTGDTLVSYPGVNPKNGPPEPINALQLRPIDVPPPVFFASIEPYSLSEEKNVAEILELMLREDPSLHVNVDDESGQKLLSGMGELHLEIARNRLVDDFKAKATMGDIEIGYRECALDSLGPKHHIFEREIAGKKGKAACEATIAPLSMYSPSEDKFTVERDGNTITIRTPTIPREGHGSDEMTASLPQDLPLSVLRTSLINGAAAALSRGPRRSFPLNATHVTINFSTLTDLFGKETTPAALSFASRFAVQSALKEAFIAGKIGLMEPVMNVVISCDTATIGAIVHDLSSARGAQVLSLGDNQGGSDDGSDSGLEEELEPIDPELIYAPPDPFAAETMQDQAGPGRPTQVTARVPLKEMVGYLKHLRSLTQGRGTFVMSVDRFERLSGPREKAVG